MEENEELREKLKTYFETGGFPTESQFAELIDSFALLDDFKALEDSIRELEEYFTGPGDYPIIRVEPRGEAPTWADTVMYANETAKEAGLTGGDPFWMDAADLDAPLVLMRVKDSNFPDHRDQSAGSGDDLAGIGGPSLFTWADFYAPENL